MLIEYILNLLNNTLNLLNDSWNFISTLIGFVGGFLSAIYIDNKRKLGKRKSLLLSLYVQLNAYHEPEKIDYTQIQFSCGSPYRGGSTFWEVINSDILDQTKDKELIRLIHEMIGWIENYNTFNNLANLSMINSNCSPDVRTEFMEGRYALAVNSYKDIEALKVLLKEKYIKKLK